MPAGSYFASHFIMGGEKFDSTHPEGYLFGENTDLNFLGTRPVAVGVVLLIKRGKTCFFFCSSALKVDIFVKVEREHSVPRWNEIEEICRRSGGEKMNDGFMNFVFSISACFVVMYSPLMSKRPWALETVNVNFSLRLFKKY